MPLSVEELLKVRYKCIGSFPGSDFKAGDILIKEDTGHNHYNYVCRGKVVQIRPEDFPHLFDSMGWWRDRPDCDMPAYVKQLSSMVLNPERPKIDKVTRWNQIGWAMIAGAPEPIHASYLVPATKEEYDQYHPTI